MKITLKDNPVYTLEFNAEEWNALNSLMINVRNSDLTYSIKSSVAEQRLMAAIIDGTISSS